MKLRHHGGRFQTNRALPAVLGLAVVLAAAPSASAQTNTSKRVSIDVTAVAPQHVFDLLAKALNCRFTVDPAVNRPLTLRVVDTPVVDILSMICERVECEYRFDGKDYWIKPRSKSRIRQAAAREEQFRKLDSRLPQNLRFSGATLKSVLESISKVSGLDLRPYEGEDDRKVTIDVSGKTVNEALEAILRQVNGEGVVMIRSSDSWSWWPHYAQLRYINKRRNP